MKPPAHWYRPPDKPGYTANALAPLGWLYARASARRVASGPGYDAKIPVICVGNINIGGTGKTPTVIAMIERLARFGVSAHVVSRGYGGRLKGPVRVVERQHTAFDIGDEPLLLSAFAPTWVAEDRAAGVRAAEANGAQAIIMDDGFQNPSVKKDLAIVVVDALRGFGNGRVIPAGPLRENLSDGLARADLVLSIGAKTAQDGFSASWSDAIHCPHLTGQLEALETGMDWKGVDVLAFAGIGHPEKFFSTLRGLGANLVRAESLDDHQPLTDALMKRLKLEATTLGAQLVTTEKDAVRLTKNFRQKVLTLPVRLEIADWTDIDRGLNKLGLSAFSGTP